ncbi:TIGR02391 family protein [[Micrococcus luteus] ATCC 49442]|uniref:TIGR02391 family protein n=1 Tax=[Micrococcus luteus] ATCC 49442 TaxID=2698727 RepID=UPI0013DC2E1A|nr:TIGR02391 family protein [[Micrococcus luteus] ATCC 49442]
MKAESVAWAQSKLDDMEEAVELVRMARGIKDAGQRRIAEARLEVVMVPVTALAEFLFDRWDWGYGRSYDGLTKRIQQIRGELLYASEIAHHLQPEAPELRADRLHPWVWRGAQSLWASGHYADAVETAAKMVNAELQNKSGRRDISDAKLCADVFSVNEPSEKAPRLRFAGDRSSETWRSRQEGAAALSRGAFTAIRNRLAHHGDTDLSEHEALEHLAVFSVIARWVEECAVERARPAEALDGLELETLASARDWS